MWVSSPRTWWSLPTRAPCRRTAGRTPKRGSRRARTTSMRARSVCHRGSRARLERLRVARLACVWSSEL
eukprot:891365-Prymnesium_polylepis.1